MSGDTLLSGSAKPPMARPKAARKAPRVVPIVMTPGDGVSFVHFLPSTTQPPLDGQSAVEVPYTELRRAGPLTDH